MSLVLRLARIPVASTVAEIYYPSGRQQQQLRQRCGIHLYAYSSCQTKLKINTSQPEGGASSRLTPTGKTSKEELNSRSTPNAIGASTPTSTQSQSKNSTQSSSAQSASPNDGLKPPPSQPPQPSKAKLSREAMRQNVKGYVFTRYIDYVKNYDKVLEKNFPGAFNLYRVFFDGMRHFYSDMKRYVKVWRIANSSTEGLRALNRKELELFMQMPRDMVKVAPALIGTSLPMIGYAFFPLVFMYPRKFLTSHFWTLQQRVEFQQLQLQERFTNNRPVFRCLQAKLKTVRQHKKHAELSKIFGLIGSGFHPSVDALIGVKEIFAAPPYSLQALSGKHIKLLTVMHGLPGGLSKRFRLTEHAFLVHHMDLAIGREGGAHNMTLDAIQKSCAIRGLNPANISKEEMIAWLQNWIAISTTIQEEHISLFLHLPIFLGYNHPNNWKLIYGPSKLEPLANVTSSNTTDNYTKSSSQQQQRQE